MTADDPVADLATAVAAVTRLVEGVRDEQWTAPTPCTEWDVRALVNHLVGGNRLFTRLLAGESVPPPSTGSHPPQDQLGENAAAAYRSSAAELVAGFRQPGTLERGVPTPLGELPGAAALQLRLTETLVHGWDLARATGQRLDVPASLAEQALTFSEQGITRLVPHRSPFQPPQPVSDDAPTLHRLVALLGRTV